MEALVNTEQQQQQQELNVPNLTVHPATARPDSLEREREYSRSKQSTSSSSSLLQPSSSFDTRVSDDSPIDYRNDVRGYTPFLPLRDFKIQFESEINVVVQISIERDSLALLPSALKLTVMQVRPSISVLGPD
ncbi:hypothetical protein K439DRAFT_1642778 [Ramaria rubella]|nr:hypothetical protein K439DRAFT_1642778 [Ramaria rubella]